MVIPESRIIAPTGPCEPGELHITSCRFWRYCREATNTMRKRYRSVGKFAGLFRSEATHLLETNLPRGCDGVATLGQFDRDTPHTCPAPTNLRLVRALIDQCRTGHSSSPTILFASLHAEEMIVLIACTATSECAPGPLDVLPTLFGTTGMSVCTWRTATCETWSCSLECLLLLFTRCSCIPNMAIEPLSASSQMSMTTRRSRQGQRHIVTADAVAETTRS